MDSITVLRSRVTAAAFGVSVLGLTAALVPTISVAADDTVAPATSVVSWADGADDFTAIDTDSATPAIPAGWSWLGLQEGSETEYATALDQVATFSVKGITAKDGAAVVLLHGLQATVTPDAVSALVADASATAGGDTEVGLLIAKASSPKLVEETVYSDGGLQGADTQWLSGGSAESTGDLAAELTANGEVVFGYAVLLNGSTIAAPPTTDEPAPTATPTPTATATPTATPLPTQTPTVTPNAAPSARVATPESGLEKLLPQSSAAAAPSARAAVVPADSGIADLVIDDTTTYFTAQPTAAAKTVTSPLTVSQATSTGFTVNGTGFAPGETIRVALTASETGIPLPGTLVADADGAFTATVVLPADTTPSSWNVEFTGVSSAQVAYAPIDIVADPAVAPVATPISGRATFTG
jgi:hypothetical protein